MLILWMRSSCAMARLMRVAVSPISPAFCRIKASVNAAMTFSTCPARRDFTICGLLSLILSCSLLTSSFLRWHSFSFCNTLLFRLPERSFSISACLFACLSCSTNSSLLLPLSSSNSSKTCFCSRRRCSISASRLPILPCGIPCRWLISFWISAWAFFER